MTPMRLRSTPILAFLDIVETADRAHRVYLRELSAGGDFTDEQWDAALQDWERTHLRALYRLRPEVAP